jgi:F-type H+-transporting ATPase subunit epsilon
MQQYPTSEKMAKTFKFDIITPDGIVFSGSVDSLRAPGTEGGFGVLADHAPFMTTVGIGVIQVRMAENGSGTRDRLFAVSGGFIEVLQNSVTMLAETCELAKDIDLDRAKVALQRAKERLQSPGPEVDIIRAQLAMQRALNRIKVAESI